MVLVDGADPGQLGPPFSLRIERSLSYGRKQQLTQCGPEPGGGGRCPPQWPGERREGGKRGPSVVQRAVERRRRNRQLQRPSRPAPVVLHPKLPTFPILYTNIVFPCPCCLIPSHPLHLPPSPVLAFPALSFVPSDLLQLRSFLGVVQYVVQPCVDAAYIDRRVTKT